LLHHLLALLLAHGLPLLLLLGIEDGHHLGVSGFADLAQLHALLQRPQRGVLLDGLHLRRFLHQDGPQLLLLLRRQLQRRRDLLQFGGHLLLVGSAHVALGRDDGRAHHDGEQSHEKGYGKFSHSFLRKMLSLMARAPAFRPEDGKPWPECLTLWDTPDRTLPPASCPPACGPWGVYYVRRDEGVKSKKKLPQCGHNSPEKLNAAEQMGVTCLAL